MKRIAGSIGMLAFVGALVWGATGAFFSDTEVSTGNTFTAGAIDLKIDSKTYYNGNECKLVNDTYVWVGEASYPVPGTECTGSWPLKNLTIEKLFDFDDIKPGDDGKNVISVHVENNDSWVCAAVTNLTDYENGINEPEASDGDITPEGELSSTMLWTVWRDSDGNGVIDGGEQVLANGVSPANGLWALYDSTTATGPLPAGDTAYLGVMWELPAGSDNKTQTDSMTADIAFEVVQSRNNEDFKCEVPEQPELLVSEIGDGWSAEALSGTLNVDKWLAKARYGQNNLAGAYELEVGFGPGLRDEDNHVYSDDVGETLTLSFDNTTKVATLTVGSDVSTYVVAGTPTSIGITAKGSLANGITKFTNATLDGNPIPDLVATTAGHKNISISGPAVSGDFVLTGTVTLDWATGANELPALQIDVKY